MGAMRLKSPASRLFAQPFVEARIKANIKALLHWPLCGETTGGFPLQSASNTEMLPFDDVIIFNNNNILYFHLHNST